MKVKFLPQDVEFEIQPGQTVMGLAHEKGIPIHSTCNGMPSCAECRVRVVEGEYNLLPPSKKEMSLIGTGYYIDGRRLSCQMVCFGDVVVDTQEHLDRLSSGPVTKKFLSRVQKDSASESHSVGDVLIQKDDQLLKQLESSVEVDTSETTDHEMFNEMLEGGRRGRHHNQRHHRQGQQNASSSQPQEGKGGENRKGKSRGGRNRRRRRSGSGNRPNS
jgi:ferredoxin